MEASESAAAPAEPTTEAPPETGGEGTESSPPTPDLSEQIASLNKNYEGLKETIDTRLPEQEQGAFADELYGQEPDQGYDPDDQLLEDYYGEDRNDPNAEAQLDEWIEERALSAVAPIFQQQEAERREAELNAFAKEHEDAWDLRPQIASALEPYAQRYGDEVMTDPALVKMAYKAIKADAASASETPAEEARKSGASLETDAGAGTDSSEEQEEAEIKRMILNADGKSSVFG